MNIVDQVGVIAEPILKKAGIELVDLVYRREGGPMVLRLIVDKQGGVTMDECALINTEIGQELEANDVIKEHYCLEVCSPGLDRPLTKKRDYERSMGKGVRVSTYAPIDGKNVFEGVLTGMTDSAIVVEEEGVSFEVPLEKIARTKLSVNI